MFLSAKVFFDDKTEHNNRLLIRAETAIPREWVRLYKRNVLPLTPIKSGALRRSLITQTLGNRASVSWRSPYAGAQNQGGHKVEKTVRGRRKDNGKFGIIPAGYYSYNNGAKFFAHRAYSKTNAEMPAVLRELGLTK